VTPAVEPAKKRNRTYVSLSFSVPPELEKPMNDRAADKGYRSRSQYICDLVEDDLQRTDHLPDQKSKRKLPRIVRGTKVDRGGRSPTFTVSPGSTAEINVGHSGESSTLKCKCGRVISEKEIRQEVGRLMALRRPNKATLTPEQAREYGRIGALKRWAKAREGKQQ
jgi:Arc/MetJ-type ribon-helix-helix transcriptional regulator